ncbi:MAG: hypothetical protein R3199_03585 [Gemmatimonadota bacterium]|nr:hypothetical protein [Gemmatimonadota bacterium]
MILLTVLTIVLVLLLVAVLVVGLVKIDGTLERIGGGSIGYMGANMDDHLSLLAEARWGVRAIETQTSAIAPEVTRLNEGLGAIDAGLAEIEEGVGSLVAAVKEQRGGAG